MGLHLATVLQEEAAAEIGEVVAGSVVGVEGGVIAVDQEGAEAQSEEVSVSSFCSKPASKTPPNGTPFGTVSNTSTPVGK